MNIHPSPTAAPPAPPEWTMEVQFEQLGSTVQTICVISRRSQPLCRMSATSEGVDREHEIERAAEKARAWIAEYLGRAHSGNTAFQDLGDR